MTAAMYRLPAGALEGAREGTRVVLDGSEGHHAVTVKRTQVGENVLLSDGGSTTVAARVVAVGDGTLTAEVEAVSSSTYEGPRFVLVQALAKGDRDLQAVEAATELGVDGVVPWQAQRAIVQWKGPRAEKALHKWRSQVAAAAKQSRRPTDPVVRPLVTFTGLSSLVGSAALALVLHEDAEQSISSVELPSTGDVLLFVGPEGGITHDELSVLRQAGAVPVRMGRYVLRASSAGPAALAALSSTSRWA